MSAAKRDENREVALILQNLLGTSTLYPTGLSLTNATALHVALVDSNGDQVTSFGGGTQYADGAARGTATGTLLMVDDGTNIQSLSGDSTGKLNINNISGTITLPTLAATSTKQSDGSQKTQIVDGSGNVIGATSNALDINIKSGNPTTIAVTNTGTFAVQADTELAAAAALSDTFANPTTAPVGSFNMHWDTTQWQRSRGGLGDGAGAGGMANVLPMLYNGSTHDRFRGDTTNGLDVDVTRVTGTVTIAGAVTNAGTFAVQESGTQVQVDDAAFTPATSKVVMFGAEFDNVGTDSVDEGDGGAVRMSANRALYVMLRDNAGNERGLNIDANGAIAVTATNATASNLKVAATLDAETTKVIGTARLLGNGGATLDSTVGAGTAPTNQMVAGAIYNSTEISPTTGQAFALQADSKGRLRGVIMDAAGNTRGANVDASNRLSVTLDNIASSLTLGTITTVSTVTNLSQMNGAAITMGNGVSGTGVQRVTIASDSTGQIALAAGSATIGALTANQSVNNAQIGGNTISTGVGATGNGTQRVVVANDAGRTLVSKGGSVASSGDNTLVVAGTNKLKVYAFSLSTVSATAVTCIFQSGASGTELWRVVLQTPASVAGGANLVVQPPAWLFATASATLLNLNLSAAVTVHYSVSYFDEA
jgi:hypothetical protein